MRHSQQVQVSSMRLKSDLLLSICVSELCKSYESRSTVQKCPILGSIVIFIHSLQPLYIFRILYFSLARRREECIAKPQHNIIISYKNSLQILLEESSCGWWMTKIGTDSPSEIVN